jgi:diaminopimelate decarboxylase
VSRQPGSSDRLVDVARRFSTPVYVYDWPAIETRAEDLAAAFDGVAGVSYAVKANPNIALLSRLRAVVPHFDVSSIGELERLRAADVSPTSVSFTGPGKRDFEIDRALTLGVGHIVCESLCDLDRVSRGAAVRNMVQPVLLRINPLNLPPKFGAHMGGGASQFGIDEELVPDILQRYTVWPGARIDGLHVYSGSNCLSVDSLQRHFSLTVELFDRLAAVTPQPPRTLVIGAGFGVAYHPGDEPLVLSELAATVRPILEAARARPRLAAAQWLLEMGRYLVAESGWLVSSVLDVKCSRGINIAVLDAGFNNHLAAAGLMGSLLRRNWPIQALTAHTGECEYTLVGPLCTSIDTLGTRVRLPRLTRGDLVAIGASGAYGFTASPTRFISHPEPREVLVLNDGAAMDASDRQRFPTCDERSIEAGPASVR